MNLPLKQNVKKIYRKLKSNFTNSKLDLEMEIDFLEFKLIVNKFDVGGSVYADRNYLSELFCPIHNEIVSIFKPTIFLDVGANYGFTSLLHFSKNPNCKIIAVEPSLSILSYLERNLKYNGCNNYYLFNAVCSNQDLEFFGFSVNPCDSQDSRVIGETGWQQVSIPSISIDSILKDTSDNDFIFIKVDTQGFEERVFLGGEYFLLNNSNWLVKTEFAPWWLVSQETDPVNFLEYLIERYRVVELPKRTRFKGDNLDLLLNNTLEKAECSDFVKYIQSLAMKDTGWCDLLIFPRGKC